MIIPVESKEDEIRGNIIGRGFFWLVTIGLKQGYIDGSTYKSKISIFIFCVILVIMLIILFVTNNWYINNNNKSKNTFKRWGYNNDSCKFGGDNNNIYFHGLRGKEQGHWEQLEQDL